MNLTYEVKGNGYVILLNGTPWIVQDVYIPYPGATVEESAQNHINALIEEWEAAEEAEKQQQTFQERIATLEEESLYQSECTIDLDYRLSVLELGLV